MNTSRVYLVPRTTLETNRSFGAKLFDGKRLDRDQEAEAGRLLSATRLITGDTLATSGAEDAIRQAFGDEAIEAIRPSGEEPLLAFQADRLLVYEFDVGGRKVGVKDWMVEFRDPAVWPKRDRWDKYEIDVHSIKMVRIDNAIEESDRTRWFVARLESFRHAYLLVPSNLATAAWNNRAGQNDYTITVV